MNNPNESYASNWLEHLETEIKNESMKIEPLKEIADVRNGDLIYYSSNYANRKTVEIKEDFEDFANVKQEEPILDCFNAFENESSEIIEELVVDFVDVKEEELSTLPITDVFCPSTGDSRPLTIDIDEEMHSKNDEMITPRLPTLMKSTKTTVNGSVRGTQLLKKCAFCDERLEMGAVMEGHVRSMHSEKLEMVYEKCKRRVTKCDFCINFYSIGSGMANHVRSIHPKEYEKTRRGTKCALCDGFYMEGAMMEKHVRLWHTEKCTMLKRDAIKRRPKKCPYCGECHRTYDDMSYHLRSMHPEEFEKSMNRMELVKCSFCHAYHKMGSGMDTHVRYKHPEVFQKSPNRSGSMKSHNMMHSGGSFTNAQSTKWVNDGTRSKDISSSDGSNLLMDQ